MNIPSKLVKSNFLPSEKINEHLNITSKYYKQYIKLSKNTHQNSHSNNSHNSNSITNNSKGGVDSHSNNTNNSHNSNTNHSKNFKSLKDEIISWFFSLDLLTKLIISS